MFGPVPTKYQLIVWVCGVAAFAGLGALFSPALAVLGLTLGAAVVALFLHDFEHPHRKSVAHPR